MSESGVETILQEQIRGMDLVFGVPMVFGMGFGLNDPAFPISPTSAPFFGADGGGLWRSLISTRVSPSHT